MLFSWLPCVYTSCQKQTNQIHGIKQSRLMWSEKECKIHSKHQKDKLTQCQIKTLKQPDLPTKNNKCLSMSMHWREKDWQAVS